MCSQSRRIIGNANEARTRMKIIKFYQAPANITYQEFSKTIPFPIILIIIPLKTILQINKRTRLLYNFTIDSSLHEGAWYLWAKNHQQQNTVRIVDNENTKLFNANSNSVTFLYSPSSMLFQKCYNIPPIQMSSHLQEYYSN